MMKNNKVIILGLAALFAAAPCLGAPFPDAMNAVKSGNLSGIINNYDQLQGPAVAAYRKRIEDAAAAAGLGSIAEIRARLAAPAQNRQAPAAAPAAAPVEPVMTAAQIDAADRQARLEGIQQQLNTALANVRAMGLGREPLKKFARDLKAQADKVYNEAAGNKPALADMHANIARAVNRVIAAAAQVAEAPAPAAPDVKRGQGKVEEEKKEAAGAAGNGGLGMNISNANYKLINDAYEAGDEATLKRLYAQFRLAKPQAVHADRIALIFGDAKDL